MDELVTAVARQVPSLAVLAFIVIVFLRAIDKASEGWRKTAERSIDAMENNTAILHELKTLVEKLNGRSSA